MILTNIIDKIDNKQEDIIMIIGFIGIGDFDAKARNTRKIRTRLDQIMYMGKKYKQEASGYYVCTTGDRRRLHDVMWETENKEGKVIPPGYVIHHIDEVKTHNEISNLTCVSVEGHNLIHNPGKKCERKVIIVPGGMSYIVDNNIDNKNNK